MFYRYFKNVFQEISGNLGIVRFFLMEIYPHKPVIFLKKFLVIISTGIEPNLYTIMREYYRVEMAMVQLLQISPQVLLKVN